MTSLLNPASDVEASSGPAPAGAIPDAAPTDIHSTNDDVPPIRGSLLRPGITPFDPARKDCCHRELETVAEKIGVFLRGTLGGKRISFEPIAQVTNVLVNAFVQDFDLPLFLISDRQNPNREIGHCLRSAVYGIAIAIESGLDRVNTLLVGICGLLHDWGMLKVSEEIRTAARTLRPVEFLEIKKHPDYTCELLRLVDGIPPRILEIVRQVHERPDGSGYPEGLCGSAIHPYARILHVADSFAALTSDRPQRSRLMPFSAMECLLTQCGDGIVDRDSVQHLLVALSLYPIGSYVELTDGRTARVIRHNGRRFSQPIVQPINTSANNPPSERLEAPIDPTQSEAKILRPVSAPERHETSLTTEDYQRDRDPYRSTYMQRWICGGSKAK